MTLRWETAPLNSTRAFSGAIIVGFVTQCTDGSFAWQITAVHMRYVAKGSGEAVSLAAGKRALARAWEIWRRKALL